MKKFSRVYAIWGAAIPVAFVPFVLTEEDLGIKLTLLSMQISFLLIQVICFAYNWKTENWA